MCSIHYPCCNQSTVGKSKKKFVNEKYDNFVQLFFVLLEFFLWLYIRLICCNFLQFCFLLYLFSDTFYSLFVPIHITCFLRNPYYISCFILFFFVKKNCCTFFFSFLNVALVSLKGFFLGTFTLLLQLLFRKISAILFLETCLVLFFFSFFFCNFLFQKFQSCFSYCSNSLFSKLSFNVTLPFLHIFSLIKCRFLCKIKFLWTWLKKWSLNRNLHYSSNTIMHTRKNTLNIFACRAFSRYISFQFLHKCINVRLFNYRYQKKKKKKFLFEFLI